MFLRVQLEQKKREKNSKPHIKKPLNAFMLYMKEQRAKVVSECTLKESAAINQILGRKVSYLEFMLGLSSENGETMAMNYCITKYYSIQTHIVFRHYQIIEILSWKCPVRGIITFTS